MGAWLDRCERGCTIVAAIAAFGMMLLTTADAAGRYLLNRPIVVAYELTTTYLMIAAVFLALPRAYRQGANVRVTFLVERLGRTPRLVIDHLVQVLSILYCAALVIATAEQARHVLSTGTTLTTIELPQWPGYALVPVGLFVVTLWMAIDLPKVRTGGSSLFRGD